MNRLRITQNFIEYEEKLTAMLEEMKTLKMYVYALEEQNETLRSILLTQKYAGKVAFENLEKIYSNGVHVCPARFAEFRTEGDCIFCLDFLKKEGQGKKEEAKEGYISK